MNYSNDIKNTVEFLNYKYKKSSKILYLITLGFIVLIFILLPIIKVDVSSQSRGIIRSYNENVSIGSIVQGKVIFVNLKNNQTIKKGDKLLEIEPYLVDAQSQTKNNLLNDLNLQKQDLEELSKENFNFSSLKTSLYQKELSHFLTQINELKLKENQLNLELSKLEKGIKNGVISKSEYDEVLYKNQTNKASLSTLKEQQKSSWQSQKRQIQQEIKNFNGQLNELNQEKKNYTIFAPISGTIINYSGINIGSFFTINQKIADISPDNQTIVEFMVNPSEIGFVKKNQEIKLQFDAFNYNQWGFGLAKVQEIDKNLTISENQAYFKIKAKLVTNSLKLKNGYQVSIKKGMTLTGRFLITNKSIWNLLKEKLDKWFNPKVLN